MAQHLMEITHACGCTRVYHSEAAPALREQIAAQLRAAPCNSADCPRRHQGRLVASRSTAPANGKGEG